MTASSLDKKVGFYFTLSHLSHAALIKDSTDCASDKILGTKGSPTLCRCKGNNFLIFIGTAS